VGAAEQEGFQVTRGRIIAAVVVLLVIGAVAYGVIASGNASTSVTTAKATVQDLGVTVTASGKVETATRRDIYAPAAGTLKSVSVTDGQSVHAGQTLATMDPGPLQVQVEQARAALAAANAQDDAVDKGVPAAIDRSAARAAQSAAQAGYDAARSAYDKFAAFYDSATPTVKPSLEATLTQLSIARKQAYAALQSAKSGVSKLSVAAKVTLAEAAAHAAVDSASQALKLAKDTLASSTLVSPIDGTVIFNAVGVPGTDSQAPRPSAGAAVAPGSAPFTVADLHSLYFDAQVDEADVASVAVAMKATVSLDAFPSSTFNGTVKVVRPTAIQTTTGGIAFPVLVLVDPAASKLLLGMSGSTDIDVNAVTGALTVPIEAVLDASGKKYVFVVGADSKVTRTEVQVGVLTDTDAQITSGIHEGDTVATSNLSALKDGMTVKPQ
jgi:HlyD family secretion protein